MSRACHPRGDVAASLRRRRQNEIGGGHSWHFDIEIDAIEQRT
jgi:hypothetical protein